MGGWVVGVTMWVLVDEMAGGWVKIALVLNEGRVIT